MKPFGDHLPIYIKVNTLFKAEYTNCFEVWMFTNILKQLLTIKPMTSQTFKTFERNTTKAKQK